MKLIMVAVIVVILSGCAKGLVKPTSWSQEQVSSRSHVSIWSQSAGKKQCKAIDSWYRQGQIAAFHTNDKGNYSSDNVDFFQYISAEIKPLAPFYTDEFNRVFRGDFNSLSTNEKKLLLKSIGEVCAEFNVDIKQVNRYPEKNMDIQKILRAIRILADYDKDIVKIKRKSWSNKLDSIRRGYSNDHNFFIKDFEKNLVKIDLASDVLTKYMALENKSINPNSLAVFSSRGKRKIITDIDEIRLSWLDLVIDVHLMRKNKYRVVDKMNYLEGLAYELGSYTQNLSSIYREKYIPLAIENRIEKFKEEIKGNLIVFFNVRRYKDNYNWTSKYRWVRDSINFEESEALKNNVALINHRKSYLSSKSGFSYHINQIRSKSDLLDFIDGVYVPEIDDKLPEWKLVEKNVRKKISEFDVVIAKELQRSKRFEKIRKTRGKVDKSLSLSENELLSSSGKIVKPSKSFPPEYDDIVHAYLRNEQAFGSFTFFDDNKNRWTLRTSDSIKANHYTYLVITDSKLESCEKIKNFHYRCQYYVNDRRYLGDEYGDQVEDSFATYLYQMRAIFQTNATTPRLVEGDFVLTERGWFSPTMFKKHKMYGEVTKEMRRNSSVSHGPCAPNLGIYGGKVRTMPNWSC